MDSYNYYKEQIIKSNNHTLNKVSDFTENQTVGFIRPLGLFLWDQNVKFKNGCILNLINMLQNKVKKKEKKITEII